MAGWGRVAQEAPALAAHAQALFEAHVHKVLATLREDGAPRLSGIETRFDEGELRLGMMPGSVKARDLLRDPRLALHSATVDPPPDDPAGWAGDAKLAGTAHEVTDEAVRGRVADTPSAHVFRVDVTELVTVRVGQTGDHLVITSWHEGRGVREVRRE